MGWDPHGDGLMGAAEVVVGHPGIPDLWGVVEGVEPAAAQQFGPEGLVEAFDLAGGGRAADPVSRWVMPCSRQMRLTSTSPGWGPSRPVNTLPLSVNSSSGAP